MTIAQKGVGVTLVSGDTQERCSPLRTAAPTFSLLFFDARCQAEQHRQPVMLVEEGFLLSFFSCSSSSSALAYDDQGENDCQRDIKGDAPLVCKPEACKQLAGGGAQTLHHRYESGERLQPWKGRS